MKKLKRNFLETNEHLSFNENNYFSIEKYYSIKDFGNPPNDFFTLWVVRANITLPTVLYIRAIYIKNSPKDKRNEPIEYVENFKIPIPKSRIGKDNEIPQKILIKNSKIFLWKLLFNIKPNVSSKLYCDIQHNN